MTLAHLAPPMSRLDTPAARTVASIASSLPSIDLAELDERLSLLRRVDRKYLLPASVLADLVGSSSGLRVLDVDDGRVFGYRTTYFDTPDLATYRAHLQGRRRRYKVRVRTYVDSGTTALEVKLKGPGGQTVKHRRPHPPTAETSLTREGHAFVARCVADAYALPVPTVLEPVLTTTHRRVTLAATREGARLTCDVGVTCSNDGRAVRLRDDRVLLETKSAAGAALLDVELRRRGVRPTSVSKYCVGVATLRPGQSGNPWHHVIRHHFEHVALAETDLPLLHRPQERR